MKARPIVVTIIAWYLIISMVWSTFILIITFDKVKAQGLLLHGVLYMPMSMRLMIGAIGVLVTFTSAIALLKGKAWSRYLYAIWGVIGLIVAVLTTPVGMAIVPGIVVYVVVVSLLFTPKANRYFSSNLAKANA